MRAIAFFLCAIVVVSPLSAQQQVITDLPEVRGPFTLTAVYDSAAGHNAFAYAGKTVPPVIRVLPGRVIKLRMQTICLGSLMRSVPQAAAAM